jgi:hypothetical protein
VECLENLAGVGADFFLAAENHKCFAEGCVVTDPLVNFQHVDLFEGLNFLHVYNELLDGHPDEVGRLPWDPVSTWNQFSVLS